MAVPATINYGPDGPVRPTPPHFTTPASSPARVSRWQHECVVEDARASPPRWATSGIELLPHTSRCADFLDLDLVQRHYYPELEAVAQQLTGARRAVVVEFLRRVEGHPTLMGAHPAVHVDYTPSYTERLETFVRPGSTLEESIESPTYGSFLREHGLSVEEVRGSRVVVLNLWRNISPSPIERLPLALCDRRTVRPAELRPQPLPRYDGRTTAGHEILR